MDHIARVHHTLIDIWLLRFHSSNKGTRFLPGSRIGHQFGLNDVAERRGTTCAVRRILEGRQLWTSLELASHPSYEPTNRSLGRIKNVLGGMLDHLFQGDRD